MPFNYSERTVVLRPGPGGQPQAGAARVHPAIHTSVNTTVNSPSPGHVRWPASRWAAWALSGERIDASATEATLGYRLRQYHVGLVCWANDTAAA
jgi:hypothetical protein